MKNFEELFAEVLELDSKYNALCENGQFDEADEVLAKQDSIMNAIETMGLMDKFDTCMAARR